MVYYLIASLTSKLVSQILAYSTVPTVLSRMEREVIDSSTIDPIKIRDRINGSTVSSMQAS